MKKFKDFILALCAGIMISIGCTAFLSVENKSLGALLFSVGLFFIITAEMSLFTGKAAGLVNNKPIYIFKLIEIWIGNFIGTIVTGSLLRMTRNDIIAEKAMALCNIKLNDSLLSLFILAIFCGLLVNLAADGYKNNTNEFSKNIGILLGVTVFILCGFEHCIADMFYFVVAGMITIKSIICLLVITLGNTVGAMIIPYAKKVIS